MKNDINLFPSHLIFKLTIGFMRLTLDPTNLMVDLKLGCMKIDRRWMSNMFHITFIFYFI
jgi:hypothetical protein